MATWTSQEGHAPPRCNFSAGEWSQQLIIVRDLVPEQVPWIFCSRNLAEQHARFPDGIGGPDSGSNNCGACALLVVYPDHHDASARPLAATTAKGPASSRNK